MQLVGEFAGILLITIPPLLLFLFLNKRIVEGMTAGAVRGWSEIRVEGCPSAWQPGYRNRSDPTRPDAGAGEPHRRRRDGDGREDG